MMIDILLVVSSTALNRDYSHVEPPVHNDDLVFACIQALELGHPVAPRTAACE